jgi:hypothetical protein
MKHQVFQGEPIRNTFYYLSGILQILGIVFIVVVIYYVARKIYKLLNQRS